MKLTDTERETLAGAHDNLFRTYLAVEAILTARLARIEALVDEWESRLNYPSTHAAMLRAALAAPTPDEVQNPDPFCTGAGDCTYPVHVHGCFADRDGSACDDPGDHVEVQP